MSFKFVRAIIKILFFIVIHQPGKNHWKTNKYVLQYLLILVRLFIKFYDTLDLYLSNLHFRVKIGNEYYRIKPIKAGVPNRSFVALYYTCGTLEIFQTQRVQLLLLFQDETEEQAEKETTNGIQQILNILINWIDIWSMQINEEISINET